LLLLFIFLIILMISNILNNYLSPLVGT
jgi:hypothetical protein